MSWFLHSSNGSDLEAREGEEHHNPVFHVTLQQAKTLVDPCARPKHTSSTYANNASKSASSEREFASSFTTMRHCHFTEAMANAA